jgi:glycosyltransferase involved in cell wall biosynthesis
MSDNPRVSIIIPVYNKEAFIERCLLSVIHQSYPNIECLIVDDCGQDDSIPRAHQITDSHKGNFVFRYVSHDVNRGLSVARNSGTKEAKGDYIFYLDADDEIPENSIELLVARVRKYPNVDIVQGNMKRIPEGNDFYELARFGLPESYNDNESIRARFYDVRKSFPQNACNKLIRREFILNNNLWFKEGLIHEDVHWMSQVIKYCDSMTFEYEYTYCRYVNPNSIMTSLDSETSAYYWGLLLEDVANNFDDIDFYRQFRRYLRNLNRLYPEYPRVTSLKAAHRVFVRKALQHKMLYIALVLMFSRVISFFPLGRRIGRHLSNRWIYRNG